MADFDLTNYTNLADRYTINTIPRAAIPFSANPTLSDLVRAVNPSIINNPYPYERAFSHYIPNYSAAGSSEIKAISPTTYPLVEYSPSASLPPSGSSPSYSTPKNATPEVLRLPLAANPAAVSNPYPYERAFSPYTPRYPIAPSGIGPVDPASTISPPRLTSGSTPRVSLGNVAKGTLGFLGLAAVADAVYNKDESALAYLLGMGPGSLVASTPLNAGEDEQLAFMERQRAAEQAHQLEPVANRLEQQVSQLKPHVDPNDLLNEAIKYRKLNNIIKKGAIVGPQEDSQITVQGAPEVVPETDTMEVVNLDETPIKKSAGEITKAPVESNTKTYDANGNLVSGSDPKVNTSNNTQRTLGTKPQPKGYITDGDRTTVIGDTKVPAKTSTSSVANPPADATTVHATPKTASTSSASVKQGNFTRRRNRTSLLSTPELTKAILNGEFGNGKERIANLTAQGYSPEQIKAAQDQINSTVRPVRRNRAPVQQRRVAPTLSEAVMYNRPDTIPVQTPVTRSNTNPSGYTKGHEAVFNPRTGRLEFI